LGAFSASVLHINYYQPASPDVTITGRIVAVKFAKIVVIFAVGVAVGVAGGGYAGYMLGHTNRAIDNAPRSTMVEVGEERRPSPPKPPESGDSGPAAVVEPTDDVGAPTEVEQAEAPETTIAAPAAPGKQEEYKITPNMDSFIEWVGYKTLLGQRISMEGGFANFEGTLVVVDENPDESYVEVIVDMTTIFSENAILTTVLKSDIFFDVDNHKTARFASTNIEKTDDGYLVTGNFTLRGVTRGIQFPAVIERRGNNVFAAAEFTIDRKQWNVGYDQYEDSVILTEVVVAFEILAEPV
jgi:polyisoprenoid-binding protein YceI